MNRTLFVQSIARNLDLSALEDLFTTVGDVESKRIDGEFGIFLMANDQQAVDVAERFNGQALFGDVHSVMVGPPKVRKPRPRNVAR